MAVPRIRMNAWVAKILTVFGVFALLWTAWHWTVVSSVSRSYFTPRRDAAVQVAEAGDTHAASRFTYPALGLSLPVRDNPNSDPTDLSDWPLIKKQLREGLSLSYAGDSFGNANRAFLTGHSSDIVPHSYSAAFAPLYRAKIGDEFSLPYQGQPYVYRVVGVRKVKPTNRAYYAAPHSPGVRTDRQEVDLVTCWPLFTDWERLVVIGERIR